MSEGMGVFCGLCNMYYPGIQTIEEHTTHTLSKWHWERVRESLISKAIRTDRKKLVGLVKGLGGIEVEEESNGDLHTWVCSGGSFVSRGEVLNIIHTTEIGETNV